MENLYWAELLFSFRSWSMTSSPYPVHVNLNIFNLEKYSHVIPQTSPNSLLSLVLILFCYSSALESRRSKFSNYWNIMKIHCENLMTSLWRNRSWPEAEKSSAQYKFSIDYNEKRIRSISLTSFEKKIQNWSSLKKITTLGLWKNIKIRRILSEYGHVI